MKNKGQLLVSKLGFSNDALFSDEKTDDKIHRHIADINDVITEQDIRDVKTDFNMDDTPERKEDLTPGNNTAENHEPEKDELPSIGPWD